MTECLSTDLEPLVRSSHIEKKDLFMSRTVLPGRVLTLSGGTLLSPPCPHGNQHNLAFICVWQRDSPAFIHKQAMSQLCACSVISDHVTAVHDYLGLYLVASWKLQLREIAQPLRSVSHRQNVTPVLWNLLAPCVLAT